MSEQASVLYDLPGPRARVRNRIIAVVFGLVLIAVAAYVISTLADNGQLEWAKWEPFTIHYTWTTYLLPGLKGTLVAAAVSIVLALILGAVLGIGRLSDHRWVRWISGAFVELFRAIPVLILMIFAYQAFAQYGVFPSEQLALAAVIVGLTLYNGSVMAEILRAGIQSLPKGQAEAASALGMRKSQTMRLILLPQAVSAMLPALVSQMVVALKDSALGYQIGYVELIRSGQQAASYYRNFFAALVVVGVIMIVINFALTSLATWLEKRLRTGRRSRGLPPVAPVDTDLIEGVPGVDDLVDVKDTGFRGLSK
ncbi:amino acid ABC transporter permease [Rhodococcus sp. D2-41]|uniref:Amino acid ABC transporter permease n=1 Tax=Speluncibacter jeojiensis TaxID=2710754 RepID=A0A9X4M3H6_9ACTN|nr:amino acid ABC transporter permease [Rhodococcus sp. D2-41]MDG3010760.1 amino acid ABC transporter permease [Rhodococcus sp. D2-41]MDG3013741.1 amino acid ABC transporter permease [Corynebacteriales bacterium D3-21]